MRIKPGLLIIIFFVTAISLFYSLSKGEEDIKVPYDRIEIAGEHSNYGVFDPSVEYNADGSIGWLAYSSLTGPSRKYTYGRFFNPQNIHTNLAQSLDNGRIWTLVTRVNVSSEDTVFLKGYTLNGVWWHEVPTIVHDPLDNGKEWKMFWHKYFAIPKPYYKLPTPSNSTVLRVYEYMWIAYKYGSTPEELSTADEVVLFGAGSNPQKPFKAIYNLNTFHPDLKNMKAYSEPGSMYADGKLFLSLSAIPGENVKQSRLILLSSKDHGDTWDFVGTVLDHTDAIRLGAKTLTGSSLVESNGRYFIFVSPVDFYGNHMGTFVIEFEDLHKGVVKREPDNSIVLYKYMERRLPGRLNSGQSDYDRYNIGGGIIMPQTDMSMHPAAAQIYNTGINLISEEKE